MLLPLRVVALSLFSLSLSPCHPLHSSIASSSLSVSVWYSVALAFCGLSALEQSVLMFNCCIRLIRNFEEVKDSERGQKTLKGVKEIKDYLISLPLSLREAMATPPSRQACYATPDTVFARLLLPSTLRNLRVSTIYDTR